MFFDIYFVLEHISTSVEVRGHQFPSAMCNLGSWEEAPDLMRHPTFHFFANLEQETDQPFSQLESPGMRDYPYPSCSTAELIPRIVTNTLMFVQELPKLKIYVKNVHYQLGMHPKAQHVGFTCRSKIIVIHVAKPTWAIRSCHRLSFTQFSNRSHNTGEGTISRNIQMLLRLPPHHTYI